MENASILQWKEIKYIENLQKVISFKYIIIIFLLNNVIL